MKYSLTVGIIIFGLITTVANAEDTPQWNFGGEISGGFINDTRSDSPGVGGSLHLSVLYDQDWIASAMYSRGDYSRRFDQRFLAQFQGSTFEEKFRFFTVSTGRKFALVDIISLVPKIGYVFNQHWVEDRRYNERINEEGTFTNIERNRNGALAGLDLSIQMDNVEVLLHNEFYLYSNQDYTIFMQPGLRIWIR